MSMDGAEDGGGAHALAVENKPRMGQVLEGIADGGGDVVGFAPAEGGIGFREPPEPRKSTSRKEASMARSPGLRGAGGISRWSSRETG
jgi:hypothetical protein